MAANHQCIGNCRMCTVLGACPADTLTCEDCGEEIEPGEEIEIEVETYERGRRGTKIITVMSRFIKVDRIIFKQNNKTLRCIGNCI